MPSRLNWQDGDSIQLRAAAQHLKSIVAETGDENLP
jgi:hypothetical protein